MRRKGLGASGIAPSITAPSGPRQPLWIELDGLIGLFLFGAVTLSYLPVWSAGRIWDDDKLVFTNPCIVSPHGIQKIWTTTAADICPLTLSTFWLEQTIWGLSPLPYHLMNVFLHGMCTVVLWRVLRGLEVHGAWLGAMLWGIHPVTVESVAWISEMKNTESGLTFLLCVHFFLKWLRAGNSPGRNRVGWDYFLTLFFATLAMASKSSTVILPLVLLLIAWWEAHRKKSDRNHPGQKTGTSERQLRWEWRQVVGLTPMFLLSTVAGLSSLWIQGMKVVTTSDSQWVRTWPQRVVAAGDAVWFYLGKLCWPHPLMMIYPRWEIDAGEWTSYLPLLAVILVLFLFWSKRETWSAPFFFVFTYYLVALLPVLGLIDTYIFRYSLVFDHFQYLASMGPCALLGAGFARLIEWVIPSLRWLPLTTVGGICLTLGILSWDRTTVFESEESLWRDELSKNEKCWAAYNFLGIALAQRGEVMEAIPHYCKALKLNPNDANTHNNLGLALDAIGKDAEAIIEYQKALELNPHYYEAYGNLGNAYFAKGQTGDSIIEYRKLLELDPDNAEAHTNLGIALAQSGQTEGAIAEYQKALELHPHLAEAQIGLGEALLQKGEVNEAIAVLQMASRLNPDNDIARKELEKAQSMARNSMQP